MLTKGTQPKKAQNDIARERLFNRLRVEGDKRTRQLIHYLLWSDADETGEAIHPVTAFQQRGFDGHDLDRYSK